MDFYEKLNKICDNLNCRLEFVGEEAPSEYAGWENSILIFSDDAKDGEFELVILKDSDNPKSIIQEFSNEEGLSASHKAVLGELIQWSKTFA